jgi:hypothetical protein
MASLDELKHTTSPYFTLSNKTLLIIAKICEETVYFNDLLEGTTTIVLLTEPKCYTLKNVFLEAMIEKGVTVIELKEVETYDPKYSITDRSKNIITNIIEQNHYQYIVTHPQYKKTNDPQNREIYNCVSSIIDKKRTNNHFTYNKIKENTKLDHHTISILKLYANVLDEPKCINMFNNYFSICSTISGIRRVDISN